MAVPVSCSACGASYRIPDSLFASRFAGRATTIKCKKCSAAIPVDGRNWVQGLAESVAPDAPEFLPDPSVVPPSELSPSTRRPISNRPRPSRPWVGLKAISIPPPSSSQRPSARAPLSVSAPADPSAVSDARPALAVSGAPLATAEAPLSQAGAAALSGPPAEVSETVPVSSRRLPSAPIVSVGAAPDAPKEQASPISTRTPSSRPPPLPDVTPPPVLTASTEDPAAPFARPDTLAPANRQRISSSPVAGKARAARWIALALGAGAASLWLSAQHREEPATERAKGTILQAIDHALARAKSCETIAPPGNQEVTVTFAPSGRVAAAELQGETSPDFESVRACILTHVRAVEVPPFDGAAIRVQRKLP